MSETTQSGPNARATLAPRPNAIVHIGWHKTGTTSIQQFLGINRDLLLERGFDCRDFLTSFNRIDHVLFCLAPAQEFMNPIKTLKLLHKYGIRMLPEAKNRVAKFEHELDEQLKKNPDVTYIISSETLKDMFQTSEQIITLDSWLKSRFSSIRYVAYVRRQDTYLESQYVQAVKNGAQMSLEEFGKKYLLQNYFQFANKWQENVGAESFNLRIFDPAHLTDNNSVSDFCNFAGINTHGLRMPKRANAAVGTRAIKMAAWLHRQNFAKKLSPNKRHRLSKMFGQGAKVEFSKEQRAEVLSANAESNELFHQTYFPELEYLFSPPKDLAGNANHVGSTLSAIA